MSGGASQNERKPVTQEGSSYPVAEDPMGANVLDGASVPTGAGLREAIDSTGVTLAKLDCLPDGLRTGYAVAPLRTGESVSFHKFSHALVVGGDEALVFIDTKGGRVCVQEASFLPSLVPYISLEPALKSPAYQDTTPERVIERSLLFLAGTGARAPYHWPHDGLTRLLAARKGNFDFSILIPSHDPSSSFIKESLQILGFPDDRIEYAHPHERIRAKEIWICEDLEASPTKHVTLLQELRTRMLTAVGCDPDLSRATSEGKKLYLSRQGSPTKRAIENGAEFATMAKSFGFHEQRMEQLTLADQIRLAATTTHVVAPHGAGLFHTLYMPGGTVVELFSVDETGRETNKPCWDRIIDVHRLEGRGIIWSALESTIVRKDDELKDRFTIVADLPRVISLIQNSYKAEPNRWNRIPLDPRHG